MEYRPSAIEKKWRTVWRKNRTYQVKTGGDRPKYYILDMFPYPSGAGLHVGHPLGYIASDILARYKRLRGFNVLHPMGYDSFGLPAEQYAIQTGIHPAVSTETNLKRYRQQLDNLGFSFDWSREVRTSDPSYYRWTQWIFSRLFDHYYDKKADKALPISKLEKTFSKSGNKKVLAACDDDTPVFTAAEWNSFDEKRQQEILLKYRLTFPEETFVNWCPGLASVLSNDEIKDGLSERGGFPVERKRMKQFSMRITAYLDRLLDGLDTIDWPDSIKEQQRNWIGRSVGASVKFAVKNHPGREVEIFTTRLDTIFGATFMVLAPEHELVNEITTENQRAEIEAYVRWAASRSEIERQSEVKKVTGAFTGAFAVNPYNRKSVPIYIADYVLAGYGTGAVMAVPSGDQRDWNFAKHFKLKIVQVLDAQGDLDKNADPTKEGRYVNSPLIDGLTYAEAMPVLLKFLEKKKLGRAKIQYRMRNAIFSRQRYWGEPVPVYYKDGLPYLVADKDLPLVLPQVDKYLPTETGEPPLGRAEGWLYEGQHPFELSTMPGWAGSSWYFYRYMDAKNSRAFASKSAINYWRQVDFYIGGAEHAVGHLLYARFWNHFMHDLGLVPEREFAKKLFNPGMIQGRSSLVYRAKEQFFEEYLWIKVLQPLLADQRPVRTEVTAALADTVYDFSFEGNDVAIEVISYKAKEKVERIQTAANLAGKRLLVLFNEQLADRINEPEYFAGAIRKAIASPETFFQTEQEPMGEQLFVSKNLTAKYPEGCFSELRVDVSFVDNDCLDLKRAAGWHLFEKARFKVGPDGLFMCGSEVEKMSKSKHNVVNPDDMVAQFGADCYRMYEMFLGPIEVSKPWDTKGITGVQGFLRKFWSLFFNETGLAVSPGEPSRDEMRALHTAIKRVTEDIERFSMNTCVSSFMIATNELKKLGCSKWAVLEPMVVMLAPFAPHMAEELWEMLGHTTSVCDANWPILEEKWLKTDSISYPIQVNGKLRATVEVPADADQKAVEAAVFALEAVQKWIDGQPVKKFVFIPGRLVNVVV